MCSSFTMSNSARVPCQYASLPPHRPDYFSLAPVARVSPHQRSLLPTCALALSRRPSEDSSSSDTSYYSIGSADEESDSPATSVPPLPPRIISDIAAAAVASSAADASSSAIAGACATADLSLPPHVLAQSRPHPLAVRHCIY